MFIFEMTRSVALDTSNSKSCNIQQKMQLLFQSVRNVLKFVFFHPPFCALRTLVALIAIRSIIHAVFPHVLHDPILNIIPGESKVGPQK